MDSDGFRRRWWVLALVLAGALWTWDTAGRARLLDAAGSYGEVPPPTADSASPTGWQHGQRVRLHASADSYHWTMQAQQMLADDTLRVRRVDYDNAPEGREVHWSSPLRWWLVALAKVDRAIRGESIGQAVERASIYASPALLLVVLIIGAVLVARLLGNRAATLIAIGGVCIAPVSSAFGVGNVDHHGIAVFCALGTVLGLAAGVRDEAKARRGFVFSGISGGVGLWFSAATQVPVLIAVGVAAGLGAWLVRGVMIRALAPRWRAWGWTGGVVSLAAYMLEYFPNHMGWRLEVNHPLHAVAWIGAAELIARIHLWADGGRLVGAGREAVGFFAAVLAVVALPMTVLLGGSSTFVVADQMLWLLHADYIEEFAPLAGEFAGEHVLPRWAILLLVVNILPLLGLTMVRRIFRSGESPRVRLSLVLLVLPAACVLMMAFVQKRWLHVSGGLWLAALAGFAAVAWPATKAGRMVFGIFLIAVLAPFPIEVARQAITLARAGPELGPAEMRELAVRDVAGWLRRREGGASTTVLSDPTTTTQMIYFGGFRGVGTLYWENVAGIRATMEMAGSDSPDGAKRILDDRGVDYVVVASWQPLADEAARLVHGLRADQPPPENAFLKVVEAGSLPAWLRPLPYRLPSHPYFAQRYVAVFEYVPDQSVPDAVVHQARYLLANQDEEGALRLLAEVLEHEPGSIPALATQAQIFLRRRDVAALDRTWSRLLRARSEFLRIEPEDRAVIALCFAAAGRHDDLRAELQMFWSEADEHALRRMPPRGLATVIDFSGRNGVAIPGHFGVVLGELIVRPKIVAP